MNWREAHEEAMLAAAEAHDELGIDASRRIDVFAAIETLQVALLFRPLRGVSGLYFPPLEDERAGILVTSLHGLARQRFTAGHELGHFWFRHEPSIDVDTETIARDTLDRLEPQEMVAEAFAAWFLMPPELVDATREELKMDRPTSPEDVYALSLRMGTSYTATAHHLPNLRLASYATARRWASQPPKQIKSALSLGAPMASYQRDVWALTARDAGARFEVSAGDRLVLTLPEVPSSGYVWNPDELPAGAQLVADTMYDHLGDEKPIEGPPGEDQQRTLIVDLPGDVDGRYELILHKAPMWAPDETAEDYRISLLVRQPLLGRPLAA